MKTTLDLPADLVREMKLRAAHEGRKLRDVAAEVLRRGLASSGEPQQPVRRRVQLPLIHCQPTAVELTAEQLAQLLVKQEAEWSNEVAGR